MSNVITVSAGDWAVDLDLDNEVIQCGLALDFDFVTPAVAALRLIERFKDLPEPDALAWLNHNATWCRLRRAD